MSKGSTGWGLCPTHEDPVVPQVEDRSFLVLNREWRLLKRGVLLRMKDGVQKDQVSGV